MAAQANPQSTLLNAVAGSFLPDIPGPRADTRGSETYHSRLGPDIGGPVSFIGRVFPRIRSAGHSPPNMVPICRNSLPKILAMRPPAGPQTRDGFGCGLLPTRKFGVKSLSLKPLSATLKHGTREKPSWGTKNDPNWSLIRAHNGKAV